MIRDLPVLAVTPGEPTGIGPEILVKAARSNPSLRILAIADANLLRHYADALSPPLEVDDWQAGGEVHAGRLACHHIPLVKPVEAGRPNPANAPYVLWTLSEAVDIVMKGQAAALVTGPVSKAVISEAGNPFSGHTEYLASHTGTDDVVMMLAAPGIRVALVTTHLPLSEVPQAITERRVRRTIEITCRELQHRFGIEEPRVQVTGLNPHAGEGGHLGTEDEEVIAPAIRKCRESGLDAVGPVPADTAFTPDRLEKCDAVIAMYHDQGLPVLKHAGFGRAVNITLGLPFIRTSVDHGTAFDIAGQGVADESSLSQALRTAQELALN